MLPPGANVIKIPGQITEVILTQLFLGLKLRGNLLSYCSNLLLFQGKVNVIKITMVILPKMEVNFCSICFVTLAPGDRKWQLIQPNCFIALVPGKT
jgi:hypothetical protein